MPQVEIKDIGQGQLERVNKLLAGIDGGKGIRDAVYNALNRAGISAKAKAARFATKEYTITVGTFKKHTETGYHIHYGGGSVAGGVLSAELTFAGKVIPLIEFSTSVGKDGLVHVSVKKGSAKSALDHAFFANIGGKMGIYERITKARFPVQQLYGPSTAHMMENPTVVKQMEDTIRNTFDDRIEHEITRILNGWGR